MRNKIIAVDFDGTLCENKWPLIGEPNMGLITYLKASRTMGDRVILWSCREGEQLKEAVQWCQNFGLVFDAVNDNVPEMVKLYGNNCRKVTADVYIDDRMCNLFTLPYVKTVF